MTPAEPMRRHVVLVGLMGSGKTTVGRLVADRLGRPFVDTDEVDRGRDGPHGARDLARPTASPRSAGSRPRRCVDALASAEPA